MNKLLSSNRSSRSIAALRSNRSRISIVREAAETPADATRQMLDRIHALDARAQRSALTWLARWRRDVVEEIAKAQGFDAVRLPRLLNSIDGLANDWRQMYGLELNDLQRRGFGLGIDRVDLTLQSAGVDLRMPEPSLAILQASQRASFGLLTNVSRDATRQIKDAVLRGAQGGMTPFQVIEEVGRNLDDPSVFGSVANRAEVITRTEVGRIQSVAAQVRHEQAATVVPGLKKQWKWSGISRTNHSAIDGQVREVREPFDIPPDRRCPGEALMFPRDPAGSACNTINCGCQSLPYKEEWGLLAA